jgi:hypothetical protein
LPDQFGGHANGFIASRFGKALLIDCNYTAEPMAAHFPLAGIGPFPLLKESVVNHRGKMGSAGSNGTCCRHAACHCLPNTTHRTGEPNTAIELRKLAS